MTDSPDAPAPDDSPLSVGDDEVERLLQEAESLTAEIAEDAGVEAKPDYPYSAPDPAPPPDTLTATATAGSAAKGLSDLLQDSEAPEPSASAEGASEDEFAVPAASQQPDDDADPDGFATLTQEEHEGFDSAAEGDDPPAPQDSGDKGAPDDSSEAEVEASEAEVEASPDETESGNPEQIVKTPSVLDLNAWVDRLRRAPTSLSAAIRGLIVWTDKPFAGLSMGLKRALGAIALATIITGIAAWVLPGALEHNPFEAMPTGTAIDGAVLQPPEK